MYNESQLDKSLRKWFQNDNSKQLLRSIQISKGTLRGVSKSKINFDYPITAIAGKNGSGKSTILALACCAFHNKKDGFIPLNRNQSYYTFVDFFVQHKEEVSPDGLEIFYAIAHDNWKSAKDESKSRVDYQVRKKKRGGRWNDYHSRVHRNVVFLGIERIVPHNEKSQSKTYRRSFSSTNIKGWEKDVRKMVGRILGKKYDDFQYATHSKYRLPIITSDGKKYSGFNMGAGENALFELLSNMYAVPEGTLIVIDEIELGLHSEAQTRLIDVLKEVCNKRKLQIICTTHSKEIFEQLPNDGRIFIENYTDTTNIISGASPEFAFSKMSASQVSELSVLVEDNIAKSILESVLSNDLIRRLNIEIIGSASSLSRQLGVNFQRDIKENIMVVFDGDQRNQENVNFKTAHGVSEATDKQEFKSWFEQRIAYLPENDTPERWLVNKVKSHLDEIAHLLRIDKNEFAGILNQYTEENTHSILHFISKKLNLPVEVLLFNFCTVISLRELDCFIELEQKINKLI